MVTCNRKDIRLSLTILAIVVVGVIMANIGTH
jgi:hypothetical protein